MVFNEFDKEKPYEQIYYGNRTRDPHGCEFNAIPRLSYLNPETQYTQNMRPTENVAFQLTLISLILLSLGSCDKLKRFGDFPRRNFSVRPIMSVAVRIFLTLELVVELVNVLLTVGNHFRRQCKLQ